MKIKKYEKVQKSVNLTADVIEKVEKLAKKENRSFNNAINEIVRRAKIS